MRVELRVNLGSRAYPVEIGAGLLRELGPKLCQQGFSGRVAVVTDMVVGEIYREVVLRSLSEAGLDPWLIEVPAGEEHKNLGSLAFIYDRLVEGGIDRRSPLVALGGGVMGDMAGFAAATFLRGIPLVQVPTTLLAQVDASIGGKTGIDHPLGKNLIGAFYQPSLVLIDVHTLKTLPQREFRAGLAEVIKYGVILDARLFSLLEESLSRILGLDLELLVSVIASCCRLKARVVEEDETEGGYRAILNFGHTVGHALESATDYRRFLHGEAVAIGMVAEARLSRKRGYCGEEACGRVFRLLERAGLPVEMPREVSRDRLARAMGTDKKRASGKVRFVLMEEIGKVCFASLGIEEILDSL